LSSLETESRSAPVSKEVKRPETSNKLTAPASRIFMEKLDSVTNGIPVAGELHSTCGKHELHKLSRREKNAGKVECKLSGMDRAAQTPIDA
jgi:hypothetical protein